MVVQDLVETTQAHAGRLLFFIIADPGPTPDALDHESFFFLFVHERIILSRGYDLVKIFLPQRRKDAKEEPAVFFASLRLCGRIYRRIQATFILCLPVASF